jgi:hypothetical protein
VRGGGARRQRAEAPAAGGRFRARGFDRMRGNEIDLKGGDINEPPDGKPTEIPLEK